jgi:hypothetical protein
MGVLSCVGADPGGKPFETFGKDLDKRSEGGSTGRQADWPYLNTIDKNVAETVRSAPGRDLRMRGLYGFGPEWQGRRGKNWPCRRKTPSEIGWFFKASYSRCSQSITIWRACKVSQADEYHSLARLFFDRFVVAAFPTFSPALIADLFATPGVTLRADSLPVALSTRDDVIRYYEAATAGSYRKVVARANGEIWRYCLLAAAACRQLRHGTFVMKTEARWRRGDSFYHLKNNDADNLAFSSATLAD